MRSGTIGLAGIVSRYLLGILLAVFGLNGFFHFLPMPAPPAGVGGQYMAAMVASHYMTVVFAFEVLCGFLLVSGFFVRLALVISGALLANIIIYHALMAQGGVTIALILTLFWLFAALRDEGFFASIFEVKTPK